MKLVTPNTTSRGQIIEKLLTFKNENAEKYGIESMALSRPQPGALRRTG